MPGRGYLTWLASRGGKVMRVALECVRVFMSREKVVRAAQLAIDQAREYGCVDISTSLVRRLLRVARTHNEFAVGSWYIDGRCGCLVGNLLGPDMRRSYAESLVGMEFDEQIRKVMTPAQRLRMESRLAKGPRIVTVRG